MEEENRFTEYLNDPAKPTFALFCLLSLRQGFSVSSWAVKLWNSLCKPNCLKLKEPASASFVLD